MNFRAMSISKRLLLAFTFILALTACMGLFSMEHMSKVNEGAQAMGDNWLPSTRITGELRNDVAEYRIAHLRVMLAGENKEEFDKWNSLREKAVKSAEKSESQYVPLISSPEEKKLYEDYKKGWEGFTSGSDQIVALLRLGKREDALAITRGPFLKTYADLSEAIDKLIALNAKGGSDAAKESESIYKIAKMLTVFALALTVAMGILVALFSARAVSKPVSEVSQSLANASVEIGSASLQLTASSQALANSAARSASSLEETAASLREIENLTTSNVKKAESTALLAQSVKEKANSGNASMEKLVVSMKDILQANEKIQELVKIIEEIGEKTEIIDEIVFQTKLLSFNASVEAERAGEHGRGFAVVAQEVGNLATMSGKAALEISNIVKASVKSAEAVARDNRDKVIQGDVFVKESAVLLQEISASVAAVSAAAQEIVQSSKGQSASISQINIAVSQLDRDTQSMSATAEESAAASAELDAQASSLNAIVGQLVEVVQGEGSASNYQATQIRPSPRLPNNVRPMARASKPVARKQNLKSAQAYDSENPPLQKAVGSELDTWDRI